MRWIVIADISWAYRLSIWGALARKKDFYACVRIHSQVKAKTDAPWPHAQGKKMSFQVNADRNNHTLQTVQHYVLALYSDGSGPIDCHARPCRLWAECLSKGVCSVASSLWTVQSVSWCCLIAAWGPVSKSFLDPIAGLWELVNIRVWFQ